MLRTSHAEQPQLTPAPLQGMITETIHPADPRCKSDAFNRAKKQDLSGLVSRHTFELVRRSTFPRDSNILNGRVILSLNATDPSNPIHKGRFVVQGNEDKEKHVMVHNSSTARPASVRLLISVASMRGYTLWSLHVTKADIESATDLARVVNVGPTRELGNTDTHFLLIRKELYGLLDSSDYEHNSLDQFLRKDFQLESSMGYPALYYDTPHPISCLEGLVFTQANDIFVTGSPNFYERSLGL